MKPPLLLCLALCFSGLSCERHQQLRAELATVDATCKRDEAAIQKFDQDIASLGGTNAGPRFTEQTQVKQDQLRPLELNNPIRDRKLTAIETEFAKLKPAVEAFKAVHLQK